MKRALFMTVGTGVGLDKEKKVRNLAHGLLSSIESYNPDKIVFFGSEESIETVESLKEQYYEKKGKELENCEFVGLKDIDDFYECYTRIEEELKEEEKEGNEIIIDYTSGTKTMTTSAAICAMLYQKKLSLVAGKRGENGVVIPGTEAARVQNLFAAYDKYLLDRAKEAFNSYRFGEAMGYLDRIVALEDKEEYKKLVKAYDLWDKFEHEKAFQMLAGVKAGETAYNKSFLGRLMKAGEREDFILVDLMNNARRRMEEGKYDDAVARLYRTVELIAQYRLKMKYEIDTSDVDTWHLKTLGMERKVLEKYEELRDEKGKIKLPLRKDFELLQDLGDEVGKKFLEDKKMQDLLSRRNNSILAHGLVPVKREDAERMFESVREYVELVVEDAEGLMIESEFPRLGVLSSKF